jgi:hypothetical protein
MMMLAFSSHHDRICYLLALLGIHSPDCERCNARQMGWGEMRERLEELSRRTQPHSPENADHGEVGHVPDSKPPKVVASAPAEGNSGLSFPFCLIR